MARYGRRKRGSSSGRGSAYTKATSENISLIRLYANDGVAGSNFRQLSPTDIVNLLGITGRAYYFRLVAVCFSGTAGTGNDAANTTLEFRYGGESYALSAKAIKPTRVRVPRRNLVASQWWFKTADGTIAGTVGGSTEQSIYTVNADTGAQAVQFIDVAIRF